MFYLCQSRKKGAIISSSLVRKTEICEKLTSLLVNITHNIEHIQYVGLCVCVYSCLCFHVCVYVSNEEVCGCHICVPPWKAVVEIDSSSITLHLVFWDIVLLSVELINSSRLASQQVMQSCLWLVIKSGITKVFIFSTFYVGNVIKKKFWFV